MRYHADYYTGYVAEVTYEGVAHFPEHHPHPVMEAMDLKFDSSVH